MTMKFPAQGKPKGRWICPVCEYLNSFRHQICRRPGCFGRKDPTDLEIIDR